MIQWKTFANTRFENEKQKREYQTIVKHNLLWKTQEQEWVDKYLTPLIDLMGDESIWKCVVGSNVELYGLDRRMSIKSIPISNNPQAHFSGAHWRSRKANTEQWFDPYTEFQYLGTNQFCQTFALMNLMNALPDLYDDPFRKYYEYTRAALFFIQEVLRRCPSSDKKENTKYQKMVSECLRNNAICFNAIEI